MDETSIWKIGQYPSFEDTSFARAELARLKKTFPRDAEELAKARRLYGFSFGIAGFVHLRRVFESRLLEAAQRRHAADSTWDIEAWRRKHVDEKVAELASNLPGLLVEEQKPLYGVLSKGIHELEEDECLRYFDALYDAIEFILEEELTEQERQERRAKLKKDVRKAHEGTSTKADSN